MRTPGPRASSPASAPSSRRCSGAPQQAGPRGAAGSSVRVSAAVPRHIFNSWTQEFNPACPPLPTDLGIQLESRRHTSCSSRGSGVHAEPLPWERGSDKPTSSRLLREGRAQ